MPQLNAYNAKELGYFNWTGIEEYDALLFKADQAYHMIWGSSVMIGFIAVIFLHTAVRVTKSYRLLLTTLPVPPLVDIAGKACSVWIIYYGISISFLGKIGPILPSTCNAYSTAIEGEGSWPCWTKKALANLSKYFNGDDDYNVEIVDFLWNKAWYFGGCYLLSVLAACVLAGLTIATVKANERRAINKKRDSKKRRIAKTRLCIHHGLRNAVEDSKYSASA